MGMVYLISGVQYVVTKTWKNVTAATVMHRLAKNMQKSKANSAIAVLGDMENDGKV